jgi:hypothetical protein
VPRGTVDAGGSAFVRAASGFVVFARSLAVHQHRNSPGRDDQAPEFSSLLLDRTDSQQSIDIHLMVRGWVTVSLQRTRRSRHCTTGPDEGRGYRIQQGEHASRTIIDDGRIP